METRRASRQWECPVALAERVAAVPEGQRDTGDFRSTHGVSQ